ncbi:MAG: hypothetical protein JSV26_03155 [bacterium]|nr:MAG: hypothetical protein JSV26_03155 [bacterium]
MNRTFCLVLAFLIVLALPGAGLAQAKTATIYGYEKAEFVTGTVSISADGSLVMVRDLHSVYDQLIELHLSKGFDQAKGVMVGQILPGSAGNMSFDAPPATLPGMDTVLFVVPGWSVPVAVGLLR